MLQVHWLKIPLRFSGVAVEAVELTMVIEENGRELVASPTVPLVFFPVQDLVYSLYSSEDQVLKMLLSAVVLSYSGLSLLSLCSRTKYQISHTLGRLFPEAVPSFANRNGSHLSHLEYS